MFVTASVCAVLHIQQKPEAEAFKAALGGLGNQVLLTKPEMDRQYLKFALKLQKVCQDLLGGPQTNLRWVA